MKYCSTVICEEHDLYGTQDDPLRPGFAGTVPVLKSSISQFCNIRFGTKMFQVFPSYKNKIPPLLHPFHHINVIKCPGFGFPYSVLTAGGPLSVMLLTFYNFGAYLVRAKQLTD